MLKRFFWIALGAALGIASISRARAYLRMHTPDAGRQFFLGADSDSENIPMKTFRALYEEFQKTRSQREQELNDRLSHRQQF